MAQQAAGGDWLQLVQQARETAQHDRNRESADLFKRAVAMAPARRLELLRELSDQLTYSDRSAEAIPLYREVIAAGALPPRDLRSARLGLALALSWSGRLKESRREYQALVAENPEDREARLGRARVLSWMNRLGPALKEYEDMQRRYPEDPEVIRNLARVQSWRGRQRGASALLEALLKKHPEDAEAALLLAQARSWMGRSDKASLQLSRTSPGSGGVDAARLREDINAAVRPATAISYQRSWQSDSLDISATQLEQVLNIGADGTAAGVQFERYDYVPQDRNNRIWVNRPGFTIRRRINDASEINGIAHLDLIDRPGGASRTKPTYSTWFTVWPGDTLRFDFSSERSTFDNLKSLSLGLTGTYGGMSMDYSPNEKTKVSARFNWGWYSDMNRRGWGQLETEHRILRKPRLLLGARYTSFGFTQQIDHGYFNPNFYHSIAATGHITGDARRYSYDVTGSFGVENASPGGRKPISSAGARATYRPSPHVEIEGSFGFFSSRSLTSSGFERRTAQAVLRYRW
jgi:hypothetical protein